MSYTAAADSAAVVAKEGLSTEDACCEDGILLLVQPNAGPLHRGGWEGGSAVDEPLVPGSDPGAGAG